MNTDYEVRRVDNGNCIAFLSGDLRYHLSDGTEFAFFGIDVVWCQRCEEFSSVEQLPTAESIRARMTYEENPPNDLAELRTILDWRSSRKSPRKCLQCGSQFGFKVLPLNQELDHPLGRGRIIVVKGFSDIVLGGPVPEPDLFDAEGNRLPRRMSGSETEEEVSEWIGKLNTQDWRRST
jgi:hypothetical protein